MSRTAASRVIFVLGAVGVAVLLGLAFSGMPGFGQTPHPYTVKAVAAALSHHTANVVSSVNFDLRGFDTLGEEFVLFSAAVAALLLLRTMRDEDEDQAQHHYGPEDFWEAVRLVGFAMLAPTVLVGVYIVVHGAVSPGGGFQGGAVLATGIHLGYLAGDYQVLERVRPLVVFDVAEAIGAAGFVLVGLSALVAGVPFLTNLLPTGQRGEVTSAGTVGLLNVVVGMEVASALILLLAKFLEQALLVREDAHA